MSPSYKSRGHRSQRGFTLIEAIVAMAITGTAVVALIGTFAAAERSAAAAVTQTQAEVLMRVVSDNLMSPSSTTYVPCTPNYPVPAGVHVDEIDIVPGGTTTPAGNVAARYDCTNPPNEIDAACPSGQTCDYGLQRIKLTVTYTNGSLSRVIYKGSH